MKAFRSKYAQLLPQGNSEAVLIGGVRTPFVKSFGVYEHVDSLELLSRATAGLLKHTGMDPFLIDEIVAGAVVPQTKNGNVARDVIINLGLPPHIHGYTLNRACTSSLQTIWNAVLAIKGGSARAILAGGVECLSDVPIVYSKEARGFLLKLNKAKSPADKLHLIKEFSASAWIPKPPTVSEPLTGLTMGDHTEIMAKKNEISRKAQDEFATRSHLRAAAAQEAGFFKSEIVPIWPSPKHQIMVDQDNLVRKDCTVEALAKLRPAFDRKYGTITAGNASALTDGAGMVSICDEKIAKSEGLKPQAKIKDCVFVGVDPMDQLLIGPAIAIPLLLKRNNLKLQDIDLFEIHEAFAAQVLCCLKSMASKDFCETYLGESKAFGEIPEDRLNVHGGAIAIGHPFGATGARLVTTIANALQAGGKSLGVISVCAAGGMAGAMLVENYGN